MSRLDVLLAPLRVRGRLDPAIVLLLVLINRLVLYNTILHPPEVQYDGVAHLAYIDTLAQLRWPTYGRPAPGGWAPIGTPRASWGN